VPEVGKSMHQIRYTEVSSKWRMPRHYYRFQVQNTMLHAMDTNTQFYKLAKDQKKNISRWLLDANSKWLNLFGAARSICTYPGMIIIVSS